MFRKADEKEREIRSTIEISWNVLGLFLFLLLLFFVSLVPKFTSFEPTKRKGSTTSTWLRIAQEISSF